MKVKDSSLTLAFIGNGAAISSAILCLINRSYSGKETLSILTEREHYPGPPKLESGVTVSEFFNKESILHCDGIMLFDPIEPNPWVDLRLTQRKPDQLLLYVNSGQTTLTDRIHLSFDGAEKYNIFKLSQPLPSREFAPKINKILLMLNNRPITRNHPHSLQGFPQNKKRNFFEFWQIPKIFTKNFFVKDNRKKIRLQKGNSTN